MAGEDVFEVEQAKLDASLLDMMRSKAEALAQAELRMADNMKLYTMEEFQEWYGAEWHVHWDSSVPISYFKVTLLMPDGTEASNAAES